MVASQQIPGGTNEMSDKKNALFNDAPDPCFGKDLYNYLKTGNGQPDCSNYYKCKSLKLACSTFSYYVSPKSNQITKPDRVPTRRIYDSIYNQGGHEVEMSWAQKPKSYKSRKEWTSKSPEKSKLLEIKEKRRKGQIERQWRELDLMISSGKFAAHSVPASVLNGSTTELMDFLPEDYQNLYEFAERTGLTRNSALRRLYRLRDAYREGKEMDLYYRYLSRPAGFNASIEDIRKAKNEATAC